ncbi:MAG: hypothetical protein JNK89_03080, partial [Saprospiraceae bacterium]|nr:hypothetical protein [Saprospiraceae bacterium]
EHPPGLALPDAPLGVAFALEFEQMLVKDSLTQVFFEPTADDLLFAAGATAFSDARAVPPGRVEFAAAGQAAPALSKPRPLGVVRFMVEDVIVRAADTFFTKLTVDASQQLMINVREEVLKFEIATDSIVLFQEKTSVGQPPKPLPLRLYPSPARQWLRLEAPGCPLVRVHVTDAGGRLVERRELNGQNDVEWAPGAWPPGWYLVQAWAADGRTAVRSVFKE